MNEIMLELPFPPSLNRYYRSKRTAYSVYVHISNEGQKYREKVIDAVMQHKIKNKHSLHLPYFSAQRLSMEVHIFPPDKRRRDLDNTVKALGDSLQHAYVYNNDFQIDRLLIERHPKQKKACVIVKIRPIV